MLINVNKLGWFDYIILITGSIVIIKLLSELKFSTINAEIFFNVWMQLPQMAFAFILFKFKKSSGLFLLKITLLLLMLFGLGYLMDVIYFSKDDLPKSELPDQNGIVRISELILLTPDGEKLIIEEIFK